MRRRWRRLAPQTLSACQEAPPCAECGRESDDTAEDGRRLCGECNPAYSAEHRAMLKAMRLGAWNPYLRPIF